MSTAVDFQLATVLSNPLRLQILGALAADPASARQLSEELELDLSRVAYHAAVLMRTGCIRQAATVVDAGRERSYELAHVAGSHGFPRTAATRSVSVVLDRRGWKQAADVVDRALERIAAVEVEAAARLRASGGRPVEATVTVSGLPAG